MEPQPVNGRGWRRDRLDHRDAIYRLQLPQTDDPVDEKIDIYLNSLPAMDFPVYEQSTINSCVAQAVGRNVEYLLRAQGVPTFHPSRMFIYWNARAIIGETNKDEGCEIRDGYRVIKEAGVPEEKDWPYDKQLLFKKPATKTFKSAMEHVALIHTKVPQKLDHILHCLKHRLPIVFGASTFDAWDSKEVSKTGVIPLPQPGEKPNGAHAIMITGWDAAHRRFMFVNSWGAKWGHEGYGFIPADYVLNPDLSDSFWSAFLMSKTQKEKQL